MENFEIPIFSTDSDIVILQVNTTYTERRTKPWSYDRSQKHPHQSTHTLYLTTEGSSSVNIDGTEYLTHAPSMLYLPPDCRYKARSISENHCFIGIYFNASVPAKINNNFFRYHHSLTGYNSFKPMFIKMEDILQRKSPGYKTSAKQLCYEILNLVFEISMKNMYKQNGLYNIRKAVNYIEENYTMEDISIEKLAELCSLHPTYFAHVFKEAYGTSPKSYIIGLKIKRAKEYLAHSDYSVNEISELVGYSDPAYFSSAFKKETGETPTEYKRRKML